jgi:hypothetical protein
MATGYRLIQSQGPLNPIKGHALPVSHHADVPRVVSDLPGESPVHRLHIPTGVTVGTRGDR